MLCVVTKGFPRGRRDHCSIPRIHRTQHYNVPVQLKMPVHYQTNAITVTEK